MISPSANPNNVIQPPANSPAFMREAHANQGPLHGVRSYETPLSPSPDSL